MDYLKNEAGVKAVIVCFSDLEGRLHTLIMIKVYFGLGG